MRNVFCALAKIIGVWLAVSGSGHWITALVSIGSVISDQHSGSIFGSETPNYYVLLSCTYFAAAGVFFFFAWLFAFKTDWVADKLKVPRDEDTYIPPESSALFPMGVRLLGLYFLVTGIASMIWDIGRSLETLNSEMYMFGTSFSAGLPWVVQICLAVMCIFKADAIVRLIAGKVNAKWLKILVFTLLAIGAIIIVLCLIRMAVA